MLDAADPASTPATPSPDDAPTAKVSRYGEPRSAEHHVVAGSTWHGRHKSNAAKTATVLREPYRDADGQLHVVVKHARGQTRRPLLASFLGDFAIDAIQPPGVVVPSASGPATPPPDVVATVVPSATQPNNTVLTLAADVAWEIAAGGSPSDMAAADVARALGRASSSVDEFARKLALTLPTRIASLSKPLRDRLYPRAAAPVDDAPPVAPPGACHSSAPAEPPPPTAVTEPNLSSSPQVFVPIAGSVFADQANPAHLAELVATCLDAAGAATDARWVRGIGPSMADRAALAKSLRQSLPDDVLRLLTPACRAMLWPEERSLTVGDAVATMVEDHAARHTAPGSKQAAQAFASNPSMWTTYQRDTAAQPIVDAAATVPQPTPAEEAAALLADVTAGFTAAGLGMLADAIATACHRAPNVDAVRVTTLRLANGRTRFLPRHVQRRLDNAPTVTDHTLPTYTFTITGEVAVAFQRLLQARNEELADEGASATAAGYHAKLIRDAARDKSLL